MKTKTILGISFAAAFAISMMMLPAYASGHLGIDSTDVEIKANSNPNNANERIKVHIDVGGDIPVDKLSGAFGYGIFTGGGTNNVLVLVTHPGITDSNH